MRLQLTAVRSAVLVLACVLAASVPASADEARGERELLGRLLAPCCWNQTLEVHDSEIAHQLRLELHERLVRGETLQAIEDDFARRYGERIRAVPGRDSRQDIVWFTVVAMLAALIGLFTAARRWRTRGSAANVEPAAPSTSGDRRFDALIEAELQERGV